MRKTFIIFVALLLATRVGADAIHPEICPSRPRPRRDARGEKAVEKLLRKMTLEEKLGQILQPSIAHIAPDEVRGTEGAGLVDVLFGSHDFHGKLSFSLPKLPSQVVLNRGDSPYDPLFAFGYGLTYADRVTIEDLPVDAAAPP